MNQHCNSIINYVQAFPENRSRLVGCKAIRSYLEGGKGVVTLLSPTGEHRTYSFRRPYDDIFKDDDYYKNALFVYAQTSSHNWMYVGLYNKNSFRLTQASRYGINHPIVKGARYLVKMMNDELAAQGPMILYHEGVCSVCGRKLTNPKSINTGIGPRCRKLDRQCQS